MKYESVLLDVELEEAAAIVKKRKRGLSSRTVQGNVEYLSQTGHHLAELTETVLPNGNAGTRLRYRTTLVSPTEAFARQQAREIYDALSSYRYR
jgi:hypothetical protein